MDWGIYGLGDLWIGGLWIACPVGRNDHIGEGLSLSHDRKRFTAKSLSTQRMCIVGKKDVFRRTRKTKIILA